MKYRIQEITGDLLDAAVAKAQGVPYELIRHDFESGTPRYVCMVWLPDGYSPFISPDPAPGTKQRYIVSADWSEGGPLIERERIALDYQMGYWIAGCYTAMPEGYGRKIMKADSPLIAAMRAYVASKLGDEVELLCTSN